MLSIPAALKIYLATTPTDMRKSHDGLAGFSQQIGKQTPHGSRREVKVSAIGR